MATIGIRTTRSYLNPEDQRWIGPGGIKQFQYCDSITLRRASFSTVTFPDGFLPSGLVLAKVTATGLYVPYSDAGETGAPGTGVAQGFLAVSVAMPTDALSTQNIAAALYWTGEVVEAFLPTGNGLDAAGRTDLAAKFRFI